ncbi:glutamyl-tRNA(Gln) amidotransferase subunit C, mitochondrial [Microplitis demolitor]|uniref:glutamyl-tRNA(Gln) amidotransferase subunit C, mitochondrial n=1 Tax=Microplitis demolitor TaxID=69319 RepID=UPI0004CCF355|nr:glutamyl-tRNA(Gln) amidotransferase subunit C, mitochondrial [Microplitis demolitor]
MDLFKLTRRCLTRKLFIKSSPLKINSRQQNTSVLKKSNSNEQEIKISRETIVKLERLSLVDFGNEAGIKRLESAIKFAEELKSLKIDDSVKPMYSVLENKNLRLRNDKVTDGNYRKKILKNAVITEEEYFVAPPGNIPLEQ